MISLRILFVIVAIISQPIAAMNQQKKKITFADPLVIEDTKASDFKALALTQEWYSKTDEAYQRTAVSKDQIDAWQKELELLERTDPYRRINQCCVKTAKVCLCLGVLTSFLVYSYATSAENAHN